MSIARPRPPKSPSLLLLVAALAGCGHVAGCGSATTQSALPTTPMTIGGRTYTLEIANTESTRETGLMRRDAMPADHGMIFVFPDEKPRQFWMENTRFPLDILFLDAGGTVIAAKRMEAYDQHLTDSDGPAKYAIELNAGQADECGVKKGDRLAIPKDALDVPAR